LSCRPDQRARNVERGATLAYDAAATADAQKQVRELVTSVLLAPK
jgi:hypothetical protein